MRWLRIILEILGVWTVVSFAASPLIGRALRRVDLHPLAGVDVPELDDATTDRILQTILDHDRAWWDTRDDNVFDQTVIWEGRTLEPHELPSHHGRHRRPN